MREVEVLTEGAVTVGPGTLYGAVKQMLKAELIEESDERPDPELDGRTSPILPAHRTGVGVCSMLRSPEWSNSLAPPG